MAYLEIKVGALTSQVTASDTKAANVLNNVADLHGFTGTNQQKLNQITLWLRDVLSQHSKNYFVDASKQAAGASANEDPDQEFEE